MPDRAGALRPVVPPTAPRAIAAGDWPVWAYRLKPQLALMAAGSGGRYVADDIDGALWSGRMLAWVAEREDGGIACVVLTETIEYPRFRALRLVGWVGTVVAGSAREHGVWLEDRAREMGCARLEALHPLAMEPLLQAWSRDWRVFHVLSEKTL